MTTPVDPFADLEARRAEQAAEYGTYAAAEQIFVESTLIYDVGHPVPASNVNPSDLSVVVVRHACPPKLPGQPECTVPNNEVIRTTGPNAVVKVDLHKQPAKSAAPAKSKEN